MASALRLQIDSIRGWGRDRTSLGVIGLMCASHFALEGCHHFLPVVVPLLVMQLGVDYTQIGAVTFLAMTLTAGAQPLFGWLADRWQPELMIPLSIIWVGLCMALTGIMPTFTWLSLVVVSASLGSAAFHPAAGTVALSVAHRSPGIMFSVFSLGGTLGVAVSPLLIVYLLPVWGLSVTLLYLAVAVVAAGLIFLGMQVFMPEAVQVRNRPRRSQVLSKEPLVPMALALLALLVLATMTRSWVFGALITYLPAWILADFGSNTLGGELLAVSAMMGAAGNLLGGYAVDRFSGWKVLTLSLCVLTGALWLLVRAPLWALMPCMMAIGVSQGATFPVPMLLARRIIPARGGLAAALVMGVAWVPSGLGAGLTGIVADYSGLQSALEPLFLFPLAGVVLILLFAALDKWYSNQPTG